MTKDRALLPQVLDEYFENSWISNLMIVFSSILALGLLAQVSIPLPYTPVPITGQTYGVGLIALLLGRKRATSVLFLYILCGSLGAPFFAQATSGLVFGPTMGYLLGMFVASYFMGLLADLGFTESYLKCYLSLFIGSSIILGCGALGLSLFIPADAVFAAGVAPFLLGDFIKCLLAAATVTGLQAMNRRFANSDEHP